MRQAEPWSGKSFRGLFFVNLWQLSHSLPSPSRFLRRSADSVSAPQPRHPQNGRFLSTASGFKVRTWEPSPQGGCGYGVGQVLVTTRGRPSPLLGCAWVSGLSLCEHELRAVSILWIGLVACFAFFHAANFLDRKAASAGRKTYRTMMQLQVLDI